MPAERPDTLDVGEIAELLATTKRTVQRWARRDDFPRPVDVLSGNRRIWPTADVKRWATSHLRKQGGRRQLPRAGRPPKSS